MSKTTINDAVSVDNTASANPVDEVKACAYLVKKDNEFFVEQGEEILGPCKGKFIKGEGDWVILPENASNRKMIKLVQVQKFFDEHGDDAKIPLAYKATRTLGEGVSRSTKLPNEKLISYLPEAEQEEYKAIIARAMQARDAEREANKKPMTEREKAEAKVAKTIAALKEMGVSEEEINNMLNSIANGGNN